MDQLFNSTENILLTLSWKAFDIIEWFDLNSDTNIFFEILFIKKSFDDFLIYLCILLIVSKC